MDKKAVDQKKSRRNRKELKFKFLDDAVMATHALKRITGRRSTAHLLCDAQGAYLWIIFEQTYGGTIASLHKDATKDTELVNCIRNQKFAEKYFKQLGWVR